MERTAAVICKQLLLARTNPKFSIDKWNTQELLEDLEILVDATKVEIVNVNKWKGRINQKALKRVRSYTKAIETIGLKLRVVSANYKG